MTHTPTKKDIERTIQSAMKQGLVLSLVMKAKYWLHQLNMLVRQEHGVTETKEEQK